MKLRPVVPAELPDHLRESANLAIEVDAVPGGFVCSATMKEKVSAADVHDAVRGERPIRKLFSKEQRKFFRANAPEPADLDSLSVLGPIFVLKLKSEAKDFSRPFVSELWLYPDGSRIGELSTKCDPSELFDVASEGRAFLDAKGIDLSGDQEMKTRKALQFFSKEPPGRPELTRRVGERAGGRCAAVEHETLAADVRGQGRGEKDHRVRDLARFARAAHRNPIDRP